MRLVTVARSGAIVFSVAAPGVCTDPNQACAATGMGGGAIDGFTSIPAPEKINSSNANDIPDVGFRCSWSGS